MKAVLMNRYGDKEVELTADRFNLINPETHGDPETILERVEDWVTGEDVVFINTEALLYLRLSV